MFIGDNLVYIRHEHRKGYSERTKSDYEFANVTVSDGMESFKLNIDFSVVSKFDSFKRGDQVKITLDVKEGRYSADFFVSDVVPASIKSKIA